MKLKKYLTKKNIIIFIIAIVIICITSLVIYLLNNTIIFKSKENIKEELLGLQNDIVNKEDDEKIIDNKLYKDDVGVSEETLYIKENASNKLKESVQGTNIGLEKTIKSENGVIIVDSHEETAAIEYNVISHTKDILQIEAYDYSNLCNLSYYIGEVKDKKTIEDGTDQLAKNMIAPNKTYTLTSDLEGSTNTAFFFDSDSKYISSTTEKTFTTPANARYIKIMTEVEDSSLENTCLQYNLVLGTEPGKVFDTVLTQTSIDTTENIKNYLPFPTGKTVVYIDGGEIELKYVSK